MRVLALCLALTAVVVLSSGAVFAASDISVTVTLEKLGVSVSPTTWPLGVMAAGASQHSSFIATNTGNIAEDFTIATQSTSPSAWAAGGASATNVYVIGQGTDPTYTTFTTSISLATNVAASGTKNFDLQFTAPASDSTYNAGGESFTVSLSATAH